MVSAIYLIRMSPNGLSILPSVDSSGGQPSNDGIHELAALGWHSTLITQRLVVSYTTFSPLPHIKGGFFLLPYPTVTNSFYIRKRGTLCCPDFPLAPDNKDASSRPGHCFQNAKIHQKEFTSKKNITYFAIIIKSQKTIAEKTDQR